MKVSSLAFFFLALSFFVLCTAISVARYLMFPGIWKRMLRHPVQSLYLGTIPMGAATLLAVSVTLIHGTCNFGGHLFLYVVWALWWVDVAVSMLCCWGLVHIMITRHEHSLESMTLAWLLPVVPLIVAASTGGIIAQALALYSPNAVLLTLTFSAAAVVIGLALTLMLLTLYLMRTLLYGYSSGPAILSILLPSGPTGQGAYAILLLGAGFKSVIPLPYGDPNGLLRKASTGDALNALCVAAAFALWSVETMWMLFALLGLWHSLRRTSVAFRLTYWPMIFPNGVYANCTLALAATLSSTCLRVWGAVYAVATLVLWIYFAAQTLCACLSGRLFKALPTEEAIGRDAMGAPLNEAVACLTRGDQDSRRSRDVPPRGTA